MDKPLGGVSVEGVNSPLSARAKETLTEQASAVQVMDVGPVLNHLSESSVEKKLLPEYKIEVTQPETSISPKTLSSHALQSGAYKTENERDKQAVLEHYRQQGAQNLFHISSPSDFDNGDLIKAITCSPDTKLQIHTGQLYTDTPVTVVIDFTAMQPSQIASLNELFDQPPCFRGRRLGSGVTLVGLFTRDMMVSAPGNPGADFWRRMDALGLSALATPSVPVLTDEELLEKASAAPEGEDSQEESWDTPAELVNFSDSPGNWRSSLFGGIQLSSTGKIEFKEGILARLDEERAHLQMVDAPWDDPEFTGTLADAIRAGGFRANGVWQKLPRDLRLVRIHTSVEQVNDQLKKIPKAVPGQAFVAINAENFDSIMSNVSLSESRLTGCDTFSDFVNGQKGCSVLVTGELKLHQWVRLLGRMRRQVPVPALQVVRNTTQPDSLHCADFMTQALPQPVVKFQGNHQDDVVPAGVYEYEVTAATDPQKLLCSIPMLSQKDVVFREQFTPLMEKLCTGQPVCISGLETNPAVAKALESLLTSRPYLFLNGRYIAIENLNLTCRVAGKETLPGLWRTYATKLAEEPEISTLLQQESVDVQRAMAKVIKLELRLKSLPKPVSKDYPEAPQELDQALLVQINRQVLREQLDDNAGQTKLQNYHWRKALNDVIAKEYRGNKAAYSFVKAQIAALFPNEGNTTRVDAGAIQEWLQQHPRVDKAIVESHFWELARHVSPELLPKSVKFAPSEQALNRLLPIIVQCAPETERRDLAARLECSAKPHRQLDLVDGRLYRLAYNALMAAGVEGLQKKELPLHRQAAELAESMAANPLVVSDAETRLGEWFTTELLTTDFQDLPKALITGRSSRYWQKRRLSRMLKIVEETPLIMLKGEAGTGKTHTAQTVAAMYNPETEPVVLSLSPEHTQEDLFGGDVMVANNLEISKDALSFAREPERLWAALCQISKVPAQATHVSITLNKKMCEQIKSLINESDYHDFLEQFEDNHSEFIPGPILKWARMENPPVLILDEANLVKKGVLHPLVAALAKRPPALSIYGETIPLTDRHRVIMTGNPESYDGRIADDLLRKNALNLYYRPLSGDVLSEQILMPGLPANWPEELREYAVETVIRLYQQYQEILPEHPFSPRDLKDVLARINRYCGDESVNRNQLNQVIWQSMSETLSGEVSAQKNRQFRAMSNWYKSVNHCPCDETMVVKQEQQFSEFFDGLREAAAEDTFDYSPPSVRKLSMQLWQELEKEGGKLATIVEGEAGRGKDALIDRLLPHWLKSRKREPDFLRINASPDNWEEVREMTRQAMEQGKVLVISELNTLPGRYIEGLFNEVLGAPSNSGFKLLATVNPAAYSGREEFSLAMQSRCTKLTVNPYSDAELRTIIRRRFPQPEAFADWLTDRHCQLAKELESGNSSVRLTLAKLVSAAEVIRHQPPAHWQSSFDRYYQLTLMATGNRLPDAAIAANELNEDNERTARESELCRLVNEGSSHPVTVILEPAGKPADYDELGRVLRLPDQESIADLTEASQNLMRTDFGSSDRASTEAAGDEKAPSDKGGSGKASTTDAPGNKEVLFYKEEAISDSDSDSDDRSSGESSELTVDQQRQLKKMPGMKQKAGRVALDGNITEEKRFVSEQYFQGDVYTENDYRLEVGQWQLLEAEGSYVIFSVPGSNGTVRIQPQKPFSEVAAPEVDQEYGVAENVTLNPNEWFALPGLSSRDELVAIKTRPSVPLEIARCRSTGLLLIRAKTENQLDVDVHFLIEPDQSLMSPDQVGEIALDKMLCTPLLKTTIDRLVLSEAQQGNDSCKELAGIKAMQNPVSQVNALQQWCNSFDSELDVEGEGVELLVNIIKSKQGVCRQRSEVFCALCHYFGIPARVVENSVHRFMEVSPDLGKSWVRYDPGGPDIEDSCVEKVVPDFDSFQKEDPREKTIANSSLNELNDMDQSSSSGKLDLSGLKDLLNERSKELPASKERNRKDDIHGCVTEQDIIINRLARAKEGDASVIERALVRNIRQYIKLLQERKTLQEQVMSVRNLLRRMRMLYEIESLSARGYLQILNKVVLPSRLFSVERAKELLLDMTLPETYRNQAEKMFRQYCQSELNSTREVSGQVVRNVKANNVLKSRRFSIPYLQKSQKKVAITKDWKALPTGKQPDFSRLAKRTPAFPNSAAGTQDRKIAVLINPDHIGKTVMKHWRKSKHLKDVKGSKQSIQTALQVIFARAMEQHFSNEECCLILPKILKRNVKKSQTDFLLPGTYPATAFGHLVADTDEETNVAMDYSQDEISPSELAEALGDSYSLILNQGEVDECIKSLIENLPLNEIQRVVDAFH